MSRTAPGKNVPKRGRRDTANLSKREPVSKEDMQRLLNVPNLDTPTGLRNRVIMELMYRCGLRVGEVCGVYVRDLRRLDTGGGRLHLRPEVTKGKKEAWVPIPAATLKGIDRWTKVRRQYHDPENKNLVITLKGNPVSRFFVYGMVKRYADKLGIEGCHPHRLRHTFATEALERGMPIHELQQILRHSDIQTTMIYTHVVQSQIEERMLDWGGEEEWG